MRLTFRFQLVMAALVIIGSLGLKMTPVQAQAPREVDIVAQRFQFTPSEITLKKGRTGCLETDQQRCDSWAEAH